MHKIIKFQEKKIYLTHQSNELKIYKMKVLINIDAHE